MSPFAAFPPDDTPIPARFQDPVLITEAQIEAWRDGQAVAGVQTLAPAGSPPAVFSSSQPGEASSSPGAFVPRLRILFESLTCDTCFYDRAAQCPGPDGVRPCHRALADLDWLEGQR